MRGLLALLPAALFLAACGGSSNSTGSNTSATGGPALQTIQISEKEYSLNPGSITLPKAGTYAFEVENAGTITHAFTIEQSGGGGDELESGDISPGSSKTVKFTFSADKRYEMYCPVDGHKAQGMAGTISIGGAAGAGTTTNPEGETTTSKQPGY
ncbi:MAG: cupredoxin domain-containing protein [Gaiellaceae bacterium]